MASYLGVDWAGSCWVVVKTGEETTTTTEPTILNVWVEHGSDEDVRAILVDIPIGLPESGSRACDTEAGDRLGVRGSSAFEIPRREVVETDEYDDARELNDDSLGSQSWWLFPRIREVDIFLREYEAAREKVYESHPEVCFAELTDGGLQSKTGDDGIDERLAILEADRRLYKSVADLVGQRRDDAEWHHRISKGRVDDVLDAAILALTAKQLELGPREEQDDYPALPENHDVGMDTELDIEPEIVYPRTS